MSFLQFVLIMAATYAGGLFLVGLTCGDVQAKVKGWLKR